MTNFFRTALAVTALAVMPFAAMAQDDGRAFDEQLADQIDAACGGTDGDACAALLAGVPANSPLQVIAITAAVNSGMTEAQVTRVVSVAKITPTQAAVVQTVAVTAGRTSPAVVVAIQQAAVVTTAADEEEASAG